MPRHAAVIIQNYSVHLRNTRLDEMKIDYPLIVLHFTKARASNIARGFNKERGGGVVI